MRVILCALVLCVVIATSSRADAYPQFQLTTGADTCRQCHFSPAGGGLINEYGRDEAGTSLSMFDTGSGRFLHGAWDPPESFQIGGDFRFALGRKQDELAPENLIFPMQMELYLRPKIGPVSLYVNAGFRPDRDGGAPNSREHYLMYEPEGATWYARAGRFFPVYGTRTQDHTAYSRRHLDMYLYDEPYAASFGRYGDGSELHITAFGPTPEVLGTAQDFGAAVYYERQNEESTGAYAVQTKLSAGETDRRAWVGGVYKRWMEGLRVLYMGQLDVGVQTFVDAPDADPRAQIMYQGSLTWFAKQGLLVGGGLQIFDEDLKLRATSREALELNIQWFPIAHVEAHLLTRVQTVGMDTGSPIVLVLGQLHYYL